MAHYFLKIVENNSDYKIRDVELLVIVENFCHWYHYIKHQYNTVEVIINDNNFYTFMTTYKLMERQVR